MNRPEGITKRTDIRGVCDTCNGDMPPSAAVVTSAAMRVLVEAGFWPSPPGSPADFLERSTPQVREIIRRKFLREAYGDFAVCPACLDRIDKFVTDAPRS